MTNVKNSGTQLDLVFWFVSRGFSVIPCHLGTKIPKIKWGIYQKQLPTEDELIRWFRIPSNAAVVTGTNNLVVIDFDDLTEYLRWSLWAGTEGSAAARQVLYDSYKVRTARGIHLYTRCTSEIKNLHFGKIDVKGRGGLVTLPGSIHPSGAIYTEYQVGEFPIWSELRELFPKETLKLMERAQPPTRKMIVDRDIVDYSTAQVLDMEVSVNVEEVKRAHRIEDYISDITFTGDHWGVAKCPFHEDANPSFWVDTEKQLCGCFSGCTTVPLDVINLYARLHNLNNSDAIRQLGAK